MAFVHFERRGPVLEMILDRPPVNAIVAAVSEELHAAYCLFRDDPDLRAGIITARGDRVFCAGWDLKEVAKAEDPATVNDGIMTLPGGFAGVTELWDLNKPIIAAVNGAAIGGGFEIVLAAHLIIASENAYFALPEMTRGFVPDAGAVQRLPRRVPFNVAMDMLLTGRRMGAKEAYKRGLVSEVVPADRLVTRSREIADLVAEGAPLAVRALLEILPAIEMLPLREAFRKTKRGVSGLPGYEAMMISEDFLEGPRAFAEGRKPVWKGR
jgi:crotonobetainyl-CoA hydratase